MFAGRVAVKLCLVIYLFLVINEGYVFGFNSVQKGRIYIYIYIYLHCVDYLIPCTTGPTIPPYKDPASNNGPLRQTRPIHLQAHGHKSPLFYGLVIYII
jgi:hypothetical protein